MSMFLPKNKRFDMQMKMEGGEGKGGRERERRRGRIVRGRMEVEMEGVTKEGAGPSKGKKA